MFWTLAPFALAAVQVPVTDTLAVDFSGVPGFTPPSMEGVRHEGRLFFVAESAAEGEELWVTDGTLGGTLSLGDLEPGPAGSSPRVLLSAEAGLFFEATTTSHGRELWVTDGTPSGTRLAVDLASGAASGLRPSSQPSEFGARVVFAGDDGSSGPRLWSTDGTASGTVPFANQGIAPDGTTTELYVGNGILFDGSSTVVFGDRLLFNTSSVSASTSPLELWSTDGTLAGTFQVSGPGPAFGFSSFDELVATEDRVLFTRFLGGASVLYSTDGTPEGTLILDGQKRIAGLENLDGEVFYLALIVDTVLPGDQLWELRSTSGEADSVLTRAGGFFGAIFGGGVLCGDRIVYSLRTAPQTGQLPDNRLLSLGQPGEGTLLVENQNGVDLPLSSLRLQCLGSGPQVLVSATTAAFGEEWALADFGSGTLVPWTDSAPGPASSGVIPFGRLGDQELFWANGQGLNPDLHGVSLTDAGASVAEAFGSGCGADLVGAAPVQIGAALELSAGSAPPAAPAILFRSTVPLWLSLGTECVLHLGAPVLAQVGATDGSGEALFSLAVPAWPSLVGRQLFYQAAIFEPGAPAFGSYVLTNGVEVIFGS